MELARHVESLERSDGVDSQTRTVCSGIERISAHYVAGVMLLLDAVSVFMAGVLPALIYLNDDQAISSRYSAAVSSGLFLFLLISQTLQVYRTKKILVWSHILSKSVASVLLTFTALMVLGIAIKISEDYSRVWFFSWLVLSLVLVVSTRSVLLACAEAKLAKGACLQRALIINCGESSLEGDQLALETRNRVRAVGTIYASDVASVPDLTAPLQQHKPEIVILSLPWSQVENAMTSLAVLSRHAVEVLVLPRAGMGLQKVLRLRQLGRETLLQIAEPPLADWDRTIKRVEDVIVAILALLITSPVLLLTAAAIKLESRGPVLFKQVRAGFNGNLIEVWKFRSMDAGRTDPWAFQQTGKDDPRVTRVGRLIRRTSLDELPQFWNVLQGQMSVVGPRPHALGTSAEGAALSEIDAEYAARHRVKPGITGWAQVNGARGALETREQVQRRLMYDFYYIQNWSVLFDIKIILMTVVLLFRDPHAY